jgi:hypothetical protein
MASQEGLFSHAGRDITAAIANGRFDITDTGLPLHVTAGSHRHPAAARPHHHHHHRGNSVMTQTETTRRPDNAFHLNHNIAPTRH